MARPAPALGDEFLLRRPVMHQQRIRIAAPPDIQCLPCPERHHPHADPGRRGEARQEMREEAGLLGAGG